MAPAFKVKASLALALCIAGLASAATAQANGGTGRAWGENNESELGIGSPTPAGCGCIPFPAAMSGLTEATQITGGYYGGLALLADGTVRAWGHNPYGEVGDGTTTQRDAPVPVPGLSGIVAVSSGETHSLALRADGTVLAWGYGKHGELGIGTATGPDEACGCSKVPLAVPGLGDVVAISAGSGFSLALRADGTVMAWGSSFYGQLGDGTGLTELAASPTPVPGLSGVIGIAASGYGYHSLALLSNGAVMAWGWNPRGQLGNGTVSPPGGCECLGPVAVNGLTNATSVSAGAYHSLAVLENGTLMAWGSNDYGELGIGGISSTGCKCVPAPVTTGGIAGVRAVSAGGYHSLAVLADGSARSWGYNGVGELGDGTEVNRPAPVPVNGLSDVASLSAAPYQSFAVTGPSQTLNVSLAGAGAGSVGAMGIRCPGSCTGRFGQGQVEVLRAEPAAGSGFAGFSGPCAGTGPCHVTMGGDQTVTATFGPPKGTAITAAKINRKKRTASFTFQAPGAVTGFQCRLIRPKKKKKPHRKKHGGRHRTALKGKGGKKRQPRFAPCGSPKLYKHLRPGSYSFAVRALDILGADANPAARKFRIRAARKKHRR